MVGLAKHALVAVGLALATALASSPVAAHCDSMDGPVVKAAQQALASGDVARVLVWVRAEDEAAIRAAFARTLEVRKQGGQARELADLWFFETLVRVHRAGEGEPYTGLKPAGYEPQAGIAAADQALAKGSISAFAAQASGELSRALTERWERVRALANYPAGDVEAGRRYVHAYVEYIHFVERVHELLHADAGAGVHAAAHASS